MSIPENRTLRGAVIDYTSDRKLPLNECKIYFSPVQAGEGTPSPENVREISGWDSVTVYGFNKRLPDEYCEVEYLESTGAQYFWTNVNIQDGLTVDSVQTFNGGDNYLFGGTALISEGVYSKTCFNGYYANHIQEAYSNLASNYYNFGSVSSNNNTIYHLTTYHGEGNRIIYINGILDETNSKKVTNSISNTNEKCVCFGFSSLGNPKNFYKGKVYSLKVSKNDILLANYVPCYRISDHTPGMFDLVTNQFYTNSGTGNFILGPEVGITIDFPKTIYGGYVDLIRGEIVETMANYDLAETMVASQHFTTFDLWRSAAITVINVKDVPSGRDDFKGYCDTYNMMVYSGTLQKTDNSIAVRVDGNAKCLYLRTDGTLETTPIGNAVLELATPNTYPISPQDLRLLRGANKYSSNLNGDIEISFAAEEYPQLSGNIVTFNSPVAGKQFEECKVYFTPKQEGEGEPSPENVRPIRGWDGIEVMRTVGANLYKNVDVVNNSASVRIETINENSFRVYTANKTQYPASLQTTSSLELINGKEYFLEFDIRVDVPIDGFKIICGIRNSRYTFVTGSSVSVYSSGHYVVKFTYTDNTSAKWISFCRADAAIYIPVDMTISNIKLHEIETITIPFPQTIYGGYVDLLKGEVVEEWCNFTLDGTNYVMGANNASVNAKNIARAYSYAAEFTQKGLPRFKAHGTRYCNKLPTINTLAVNGIDYNCLQYYNTASTNNQNEYISIMIDKDELADTSDNFKIAESINEWLSNNPLQVLYNIAEPISYSLTPETITTLKGTNTLFSNTNGNITIRAIGNVPSPIHSSDLLRREINGAPHIESKTGNYLTFNTDMEMPLTSGKIYFSPKQDLHGYSKPWVGGAGKNLLNINDIVVNEIITEDGTMEENVSFSHTNKINVNEGIYTFSCNKNTTGNHRIRIHGYDENDNWIEQITSQVQGQGTTQFNIQISITSNIKYIRINLPNPTTNHQLEKGSTATAYEPYENICPIEGWDGIEVIKCGKNLIDIQDMKDTYPWGSNTTYKGYTLFVGSNKTVTISHLTDIANGCDFYVNVGVKASQKGISGAPYWIYHKSAPSMRNKQLTVTADNDGRIYINVYAIGTKGLDQFYTFLLDDGFQIEYGDTVTTWEPFNSFETIVIPFNRTIYGGYVDLVSGEVVETWNSKTIDGTNIQDYAGNGYSGTQCTNRYITFTPNSSQSYRTNTAISNYLESKKYAVWSNANNYPNCFTINGGYQLHVCFLNDIVGITSGDSNTVKTNKIKAYLTNHPMQLVYPLKTADMGHYSFTMQPITTLSGINNLWTTANGETQISYYRHSDDSYQYINAQAIASNNNYLLVTDDGFVIGNEENVTVY